MNLKMRIQREQQDQLIDISKGLGDVFGSGKDLIISSKSPKKLVKQKFNTDSAEGTLVSFAGAKGMRLDGMLHEAPNATCTVVHVHGSYGNFYSADFVRVMSKAYAAKGINLLVFNTSAHDCISEAYFEDGRFDYAGGGVTPFKWVLEDIDGAVKFCKKLKTPLVLQGHSLGCDRIVYWARETKSDVPLVLLSPADSYMLGSRSRGDQETIKQQIKRLKSKSGDEIDMLGLGEYSVKEGDWTYPLPITREALLSILEGPVYKQFRYGSSPSWGLGSVSLVCSAKNDALLTASIDEVRKFFKQALPNSEFAGFSSDHMFDGEEARLANKIASWIDKVTTNGH
jgi:hypothetical protein